MCICKLSPKFFNVSLMSAQSSSNSNSNKTLYTQTHTHTHTHTHICVCQSEAAAVAYYIIFCLHHKIKYRIIYIKNLILTAKIYPQHVIREGALRQIIYIIHGYVCVLCNIMVCVCVCVCVTFM